MNPRIPPSLLWLIPAPVVFLAGVGGGLAWLFIAVSNAPIELHSFRAPGRIPFQIDNPGAYILWREVRSPGLADRLSGKARDPAGQPAVSLVQKRTAATLPGRQTLGVQRLDESRRRVAIARWDVEESGDYELQVGGVLEGSTFSFGPSQMGGITAAVVGCAVLNLAGWGGAFAIVLAVFTRRTRTHRLAEPAA